MIRPNGASLYAKKLAELRLGFFASADDLAARAPAFIDPHTERLLIYDDSYGRLPELGWVAHQGFSEAVAMRSGSARELMTFALGYGFASRLRVPFIVAY